MTPAKLACRGSPVIFQQRETDVGLGNRGDQPLTLALGFVHGFLCLRDVFLEGDRVAPFAFALAL
jgi:hypothetical protein